MAGGGAVDPTAVPDTGPSVKLPTAPPRSPGSAARVRPALVCSGPPRCRRRGRASAACRSPPLGLSSANQYAVPAVSDTGVGRVTSFQAPGVTDVIVPLPSRLVAVAAASP